MYQIKRRFAFSAAHTIPGEGKCEQIHGHNYVLWVWVRSEYLDEKGMIFPFERFKAFGADIVDTIADHNFFNEFLADSPLWQDITGGHNVDHVTTERLARYFFEFAKQYMPQVFRIELYETENNCAIYEEW